MQKKFILLSFLFIVAGRAEANLIIGCHSGGTDCFEERIPVITYECFNSGAEAPELELRKVNEQIDSGIVDLVALDTYWRGMFRELYADLTPFKLGGGFFGLDLFDSIKLCSGSNHCFSINQAEMGSDSASFNFQQIDGLSFHFQCQRTRE